MAHNVASTPDIRHRKPRLTASKSPTSPKWSDEPQQRPWPPPEHRSRAPEFYGFVAWTTTYLLFGIYLLWAFLPDDYIVWLGVTWYPNREWSILVPAWSIVAVLFTYFVYFALALQGAPPLDDINSITDARALYPNPQDGWHNVYLAAAKPDAIPELYDIPLSFVNRVLYQADDIATKDQNPRSEPRHPTTNAS